MYVLTCEYNEYHQYGHYLEAVFENNPTLNELSMFLYAKPLEDLTDEMILLITHIKRGGGRINIEHKWYHLRKIESGEKYKH